MNRHTLSTFILILGVMGVIGFLLSSVSGNYSYLPATNVAWPDTVQSAASTMRAFFEPGVPEDVLRAKYEAVEKGGPKVRLLLMPGHEPGYGGAEYKDLKEREMALELVNSAEDYFEQDGHFEVIVPRDDTQWNGPFNTYFKERWNEIVAFQQSQKSEMFNLINGGSIQRISNKIEHTKAPDDVALRLYGINKWANENDVDLAIHVHFNDYLRRKQKAPGQYSGFAIYVPEKQYSNSATTKIIANALYKRLSKYNPVSDMPQETTGVVEEQELIAIGSYNTSGAPSMLVEYGYIYEPQFAKTSVRNGTLKDMGLSTYLGVKDFFVGGDMVAKRVASGDLAAASMSDTALLPRKWNVTFSKDTKTAGIEVEVLALQRVLAYEGLYPVAGRSKNECPSTGTFGPCTQSAFAAFQKLHGIVGEKDKVGPKTLKYLNEMYGADAVSLGEKQVNKSVELVP